MKTNFTKKFYLRSNTFFEATLKPGVTATSKEGIAVSQNVNYDTYVKSGYELVNDFEMNQILKLKCLDKSSLIFRLSNRKDGTNKKARFIGYFYNYKNVVTDNAFEFLANMAVDEEHIYHNYKHFGEVGLYEVNCPEEFQKGIKNIFKGYLNVFPVDFFNESKTELLDDGYNGFSQARFIKNGLVIIVSVSYKGEYNTLITKNKDIIFNYDSDNADDAFKFIKNNI